MKVQIFIDLHTEYLFHIPKIIPLADCLFLAGDIGKINAPIFDEFLDYVSSCWKQVVYILGNHEYYHSKKTISKLNLEYKTLFQTYNNIHLLDDSYIIFL